MFIRRTKTRTTENGKSYYSHRLVDTYRVAEGVHQRTLLNLGSAFDCPRKQWPELTERIEQIIQGQVSLFEPLPEIEQEAQAMAARLLNKYANSELLSKPQQDLAGGAEAFAGGRDLQTVDINSLDLMDVRTVGAEALALSALQQVKFVEKLNDLGFNRNQGHAAIGNIVGRMVQPGSELSTHEWLQTHSALGELVGFDYQSLGLSALYRASDQLWKHHDEIEATLYKRHKQIFGLEETITLYDLTNTFFEGTGKYNDHAAYGHSKERRSDCPLVTLALVLDGSGFSRKSRIFPGNISEPSTLQKMIEDLSETPATENSEKLQGELAWDKRPTIVMDAGIASKDNVDWLRQQGYPYIVVSRKRHLEFDPAQAVFVKTSEHDKVRAQRIECADGEIELYCHSERKEQKEQSIVSQCSERFEQALKHLAEGLKKPRRLKTIEKVQQKIGRLKQKYARVASHYTLSTETDEKKEKVTALSWKRIERKNHPKDHPGVYCLRTNQTQWSEVKIWRTYTLLTDLESVFRSLKSELGMRPVFHQKTHRVEGHIFITLLAYNLVHQIRLTLKAQDVHESWATVRSTMSTQTRTTVTLQTSSREQIHIRKSSYPKNAQQSILRALGLSWCPGKTKKTKSIKPTHKQ
ncbi:MAG: IS1634 family transposase [bacterium]